MVASKPNSPPRKGPRVEAQLERLYQRRLLVEDLIQTLEAYARAGPPPAVEPTRRVA